MTAGEQAKVATDAVSETAAAERLLGFAETGLMQGGKEQEGRPPQREGAIAGGRQPAGEQQVGDEGGQREQPLVDHRQRPVSGRAHDPLTATHPLRLAGNCDQRRLGRKHGRVLALVGETATRRGSGLHG